MTNLNRYLWGCLFATGYTASSMYLMFAESERVLRAFGGAFLFPERALMWRYVPLLLGSLLCFVAVFMDRFAREVDFPGWLDDRVIRQDMIVKWVLLGLVIGVFWMIGDRMLELGGGWKGIPLGSPLLSFAVSLRAVLLAELLYRGLLFVLIVWTCKKLWGQVSFAWANLFVAFISALAYVPVSMGLFKLVSVSQIPFTMWVGLIVLQGGAGVLFGVVAIRYGLWASVIVHLCADLVWHTLWPIFA